jgi:FkbM family methyltransferase
MNEKTDQPTPASTSGEIEALEASAWAQTGRSDVEVIPIDYKRHELRILAGSKQERSWRAKPGRREPWTLAWLEDATRRGDIVYDVGANVGVFSLIAAKLLGGVGVVVAFEPGFASYARLCENVALNGLSSVVVPVPLALSSSSGLQAFTYRSTDPGESRHTFSAEAWSAPAGQDRRKRYTQPIVALTLDEAVPLLGLSIPNLVKLDVDGAEGHVLRGGRRTLSTPACRSVFAEIDNANTDEVVSLLESYGFRLEARYTRKKASSLWHGAFHRVEHELGEGEA